MRSERCLSLLILESSASGEAAASTAAEATTTAATVATVATALAALGTTPSAGAATAEEVHAVADVHHGVAGDGVDLLVTPAVSVDGTCEVGLLSQDVIPLEHDREFLATQETM